MKNVTANELQLMDIIRPFNGVYCTATVIKIEEERIKVIRPYIHTSRVETLGGVIPYIGWEEYFISKTDMVELVEKGVDLDHL